MAMCKYVGCRKRQIKGINFCKEHEDLSSQLTESELLRYRALEAEIRADLLAQKISEYEINDIRFEMRQKISQKREIIGKLKERVSKRSEEYAKLLADIKDSRNMTSLSIDPETGEIADVKEM